MSEEVAAGESMEEERMQQKKIFGVKVEEGRKGRINGEPSVGAVYRNPLAQHAFPPTDPNLSTAWQIFR